MHQDQADVDDHKVYDHEVYEVYVDDHEVYGS